MKLRALKPKLQKQFHAESFGIFGSFVIGEQRQCSDVDIIVEFNQPVGVEFIDLADLIEKELNLPVDLVSKRGIKEKYLKAIEHEISEMLCC